MTINTVDWDIWTTREGKTPHESRDSRLSKGTLIMAKQIPGTTGIYMRLLCILWNFEKMTNNSIQEHLWETEEKNLKKSLTREDIERLPTGWIIEIWGEKNPYTSEYHVLEYKKIK